MQPIGKIERVPLREVWPHEAYDLTTWLEENVDVLDDVVGLGLVSAQRERAVGAFSVDLVAEDELGRTVVIENQLDRSNHDHLGKLITYTAMTDANAAIWIVSEPRPEHVRAISWLNDSAPADFYLLKIEGVRIGESDPAPLLTLIVRPSEEGRKAGEVKKGIAEGGSIRHRFWSSLLEGARSRTRLHSAISPSDQTWLSTSAGKTGLAFVYSVTQHSGQVELYIDRGSGSANANLAIFNELRSHKDEIEAAFGEPLEWQPLEGKQACRIRKRFEGVGYRDEEKWTELESLLVDAMVRIEQAFRPYINRLQI
ncbi:MAG TPA: DUF4268 domain-containing protein [Streptosporangiaceae bacterium]|nr:DUF4268 domain-containing protein [Streptosporangiaceae bacterium]